MPGFALGVAEKTGAIVTHSESHFAQVLMAANYGISYEDVATFADDRASRVIASLCDPQVAALWMYNGGRLKQAHKTKGVMLAIVKALQNRLKGDALRSFRSMLRGLKGKMHGQSFAVGVYGQKPILGYCYGTGIMTLLALAGIGRPVHCPLFMDAGLYVEYEDWRLAQQLRDLAGAIMGHLRLVVLPPLEPQNYLAEHARKQQGVLEGFVICGLLQIVHATVTGFMANKRQPVILMMEYLDFGDEPQLLRELGLAHRSGKAQIVAVCSGYKCLKDDSHSYKFDQALHEFMSSAPDVPVFGGLPIGHDRPNHVVPMGWGKLYCPQRGQVEYRMEFNQLIDGNFEMLRKTRDMVVDNEDDILHANIQYPGASVRNSRSATPTTPRRKLSLGRRSSVAASEVQPPAATPLSYATAPAPNSQYATAPAPNAQFGGGASLRQPDLAAAPGTPRKGPSTPRSNSPHSNRGMTPRGHSPHLQANGDYAAPASYRSVQNGANGYAPMTGGYQGVGDSYQNGAATYQSTAAGYQGVGDKYQNGAPTYQSTISGSPAVPGSYQRPSDSYQNGASSYMPAGGAYQGASDRPHAGAGYQSQNSSYQSSAGYSGSGYHGAGQYPAYATESGAGYSAMRPQEAAGYAKPLHESAGTSMLRSDPQRRRSGPESQRRRSGPEMQAAARGNDAPPTAQYSDMGGAPHMRPPSASIPGSADFPDQYEGRGQAAYRGYAAPSYVSYDGSGSVNSDALPSTYMSYSGPSYVAPQASSMGTPVSMGIPASYSYPSNTPLY
uniref:LD-carboxypeptidase C-terminal domain-containing protein n=1 Tax=Eutreptiella gymnastica TaxID=73025 RepID=A0A7S4LMD0_9EUGL